MGNDEKRAVIPYIADSQIEEIAQGIQKWIGRWLPCDRCGEVTSCSPCPACQAKERADVLRQNERAQAFRSTSRSIPQRFAWATGLDVSILGKRVRLPGRENGLQRAVSLLDEHRIAFRGPSGSGKSSFAAALLREWSRHTGKAGLWVPCYKLARAQITSRLGQENDLLERAEAAALVVLDELGGEQDLPSSCVPELILSRYDSDLPTWITTGKDNEWLQRRYGDQIFGRVIEGAREVLLKA